MWNIARQFLDLTMARSIQHTDGRSTKNIHIVDLEGKDSILLKNYTMYSRLKKVGVCHRVNMTRLSYNDDGNSRNWISKKMQAVS